MARILITDDDAYMLRVLAMWLGRNGHQVVEASNGKMATKILQNESVDMIVSDINMPEMNGVELAQWLRREQGLNTPMILLSSRCDQIQIAEKLGPLGISIHPKPFSPSRLMAQIEVALATHAPGGHDLECQTVPPLTDRPNTSDSQATDPAPTEATSAAEGIR